MADSSVTLNLTWVELAVPGAEHQVADFGWLLARVQQGPGGKSWLWSVVTHNQVIANGECANETLAKGHCHHVVASTIYQGHQ